MRDGAGHDHPGGSSRSFVRRSLLVVLIVAVAAFFWAIIDVLLLVFGAVLLAIALRSVAALLQHVVRGPEWIALTLAIALAFLLGMAVAWLFGSQLTAQINELVALLPQSWAKLNDWLAQRPWGGWVLEEIEKLDASTFGRRVASSFLGAFTSALLVIGNLVLILVAGIYVAAQPTLYRAGVLRLFPPDKRRRAGEFLDTAGATLRHWLLGQILAMTTVGTLTAAGLWALGVPSPIALGIIVGLLDFIPFVGPILGAVPAMLAGFFISPTTAVYVGVLFLIVQQIEANIVQPLVQRKAASLPPVLTLFATVALGLVFGPLGLIFATPLAVVGMVATKMLYVGDMLGDRTPGAQAREAADVR